MSKIKEVIKNKEHGSYIFKPNRKFYTAVNINQKRFGMIYRGDISPTIEEAKALAEYFEVDVTELL